jgi:hypothetical protein
MRTLRVLTVACLLVTAAACQSNNKGKIVGKWRSVEGQLPRGGMMVLDFTADGRVTIEAWNNDVSRRVTGRYRLYVSDYVHFSELSEPIAGFRSHSETVRINGNILTMSDFDGRTLDFSRF